MQFQFISRNPVLLDLYDSKDDWQPPHISLADLADLLHQSGERSRAETAMMKALKLAPNTVDYYERAGLILQDSGNSEEAAKFFKTAIELRKEIEGAIREQRSHMSEIPQISLSQT